MRIFFVQLILLFLVLACYGGQMLWNLRKEKMRKKRILSLMSKKISFSDVDIAKAGNEEEEDGDDEEEEEEEEGEEEGEEEEDDEEEEEEEEDSTKVEDHIE